MNVKVSDPSGFVPGTAISSQPCEPIQTPTRSARGPSSTTEVCALRPNRTKPIEVPPGAVSSAIPPSFTCTPNYQHLPVFTGTPRSGQLDRLLVVEHVARVPDLLRLPEPGVVLLVVEVLPVDQVDVWVIHVAAVHLPVRGRTGRPVHGRIEVTDPGQVCVALRAVGPVGLVLELHDRGALRHRGRRRVDGVHLAPVRVDLEQRGGVRV